MSNLEQIRKQMSSARRKKIEARAAQLIAEEMTLQELRRARKLTQVHMAKALGISQDGVSRLEQRSDLLLSTLRKTIKAMGGNLSLIAEFPDREPVVLTGISTPETELQPAKGKHRRAQGR
ncbi:MAG TPA: helix-turn-helix transcriptional regulator [Blastocatellia bacterium]|jgi:Helix-turn-helix.|nr:helix-turn-helix transcriptional regulator [Blastocatellia bacterium]